MYPFVYVDNYLWHGCQLNIVTYFRGVEIKANGKAKGEESGNSGKSSSAWSRQPTATMSVTGRNKLQLSVGVRHTGTYSGDNSNSNSGQQQR